MIFDNLVLAPGVSVPATGRGRLKVASGRCIAPYTRPPRKHVELDVRHKSRSALHFAAESEHTGQWDLLTDYRGVGR